MSAPASSSSVATPPSLADLLARSDIWTGARLAAQGETLASGFPALDAELPGGGWPRGALVDVLQQDNGIGELALLLPALAQLTTGDEWVLLLAPPRLFAPAWRAAGVALSRLIVVDAPQAKLDKRAAADCLWAAEQVLRAGSVSAALMWLPARTDAAHLRRLQLAAEAGGSCGFVLQDERRLAAPSPAPLRLHLLAPADESALGRLAVHIVKRRGPPHAQPLQLDLPRPWLRVRRRFATPLPVNAAKETNAPHRPMHAEPLGSLATDPADALAAGVNAKALELPLFISLSR